MCMTHETMFIRRCGLESQQQSSGPQMSVSPSITSSDSGYDLYIDIDGTLLRTDLLYEAAWRYVRFAPWRIVRLFCLLLKGRAALKSFLARKVPIDPATLPYEKDLVEYLRQQRPSNCRIILITASHWTYARKIARHLALSDADYGSSNRVNLKSTAKLEKIRRISGERPFVYAGNSSADRPIWDASSGQIFVNAPKSDVAKARPGGQARLVIQNRPGTVRGIPSRNAPPPMGKKRALVCSSADLPQLC